MVQSVDYKKKYLKYKLKYLKLVKQKGGAYIFDQLIKNFSNLMYNDSEDNDDYVKTPPHSLILLTTLLK